ncbi:hypothetical protein [Mucilaginibacter sp.]|uniref:hypothetical protein n=1 Tax=Mucilaginibacter sp. TaxID=1882438 RepID=UPI0028438D89|nr:hypothetical protein [Mucilaginibacter sp.]MDR3697112.1 hypothetical protein [Mucilaginibacter sp.]
MKKTGPLILILSLNALFQSCGGGAKKNPSDTIQKKTTVSARASVNATPPPCPNCWTLDGVDGGIAVQRFLNFKTLQGTDKNPQKAASVFFTTDQLQQIDELLANEYGSLPAAQQPDGVRFYFGCDQQSSGSKLNILIHLVSTRKQDPAGDPHKSAHGDYYEHNIASPKTLNGIQNNGTTILDPLGNPLQTGTVYQNPGSGTRCTNEPGNYIDETAAYTWAFNNRYNKPDPINTQSDWFRLCFIQYLFETIYKHPTIFNGLRAYLVLGPHQSYSYNRDFVILVPIDKQNRDYAGCIAELDSLPSSCHPETDLWIQSLKEYYKAKKNWKELSPAERLRVKKHIRYPFFYSHAVLGGGYDNGELCPDVCN